MSSGIFVARLADRAPALVHVELRLQDDAFAADRPLRTEDWYFARATGKPCARAMASIAMKPMAIAGVLPAGIAEPDEKQHERALIKTARDLRGRRSRRRKRAAYFWPAAACCTEPRGGGGRSPSARAGGVIEAMVKSPCCVSLQPGSWIAEMCSESAMSPSVERSAVDQDLVGGDLHLDRVQDDAERAALLDARAGVLVDEVNGWTPTFRNEPARRRRKSTCRGVSLTTSSW